MNSSDFRSRLTERQKIHNTLLCVGLDPDFDKMPNHLKESVPNDNFQRAHAVSVHMRNIVTATAEFACMFKPQKAHWEALGQNGQLALYKVVRWIKTNYPDIPIFLDCKRGDIDNTQEMYKIAHFKHDEVDGMNFNPYMGKGCMKSLIDKEHLERALVGLCYTSNPEAREVQDVLLDDGRQYWEFIAEKTLSWAEEFGVVENAGLVMAAAYERPKDSGVIFNEHLIRCRQIVGDKLWFLIPGVGKQGGAIEETVQGAYRGPGSIAINESRSINFASTGKDFMEAAANAARKSRDAMNEALEKMN
jgi:orotidine-5'-phosphate decarboxylase